VKQRKARKGREGDPKTRRGRGRPKPRMDGAI
jgi:hypothetical protein